MAVNRYVFAATTDANGRELWVTDGTAAGTILVKDIRTGTAGSSPDNFYGLGNGKVVFEAGSASARELWVTDGTSSGTSLLENTATLGADTYYYTRPNFTPIGNGKLLFRAGDTAHGIEPWVTDGTAAGTHIVADLRAGTGNSMVGGFIPIGGGRAVFGAAPSQYGIFVTDGAETGTVKIADARVDDPLSYAALGDGRFVFSASTQAAGSEVWVTDGTASGTHIVKDLASGSSTPTDFVSLGNGRVVFEVSGSSGNGIGVTDGTAGGTFFVGSVNFAGYGLAALTAFGTGKAIFAGANGSGSEPWITDGTPGGTFQLADLMPGTGGSAPANFTRYGADRVAFSAEDATGVSVYVTNGSGVTKLATVGKVSGFRVGEQFADLGDGRLLFDGNAPIAAGQTQTANRELFVSAGAPDSATLIEIAPGSDSSSPTSFRPIGNGQALFSAFAGNASNTTGAELWITDGTSGGTRLVKDINPGTVSSSLSGFTLLAGTLAAKTAHDLGGDGRADILYRQASSGNLVLAQLDGSHQAAPSAFTDVQLNNDFAVVSTAGDFNGDGKSDILFRKVSSGSTLIAFQDGSHQAAASAFTDVQVGNDYAVAGVADFNGDGKADLLFRNVSSGATAITPLDGSHYAAPTAFTGVQIDTSFAVAGTGDFDGDGKADILFRKVASGSTLIAFQDGAAQAKASAFTDVQVGNDYKVWVADFDGDGKSDLLFRNVNTGQTAITLMDGSHQKAATAFTDVQLDNRFEIAQLSDFNGDGKADILYRDASSGSTLVAFMDGAHAAAPSAFTDVQVDHSWLIV